MSRGTIQKKVHTIGAVVCITASFAFVLFAGVTLGATPAHAQQVPANVPAPDVANPRAPRPPISPFGYGGGPRAPRPPDLAGRLGPIFQRFLSFLSGLFGL